MPLAAGWPREAHVRAAQQRWETQVDVVHALSSDGNRPVQGARAEVDGGGGSVLRAFVVPSTLLSCHSCHSVA